MNRRAPQLAPSPPTKAPPTEPSPLQSLLHHQVRRTPPRRSRGACRLADQQASPGPRSNAMPTGPIALLSLIGFSVGPIAMPEPTDSTAPGSYRGTSHHSSDRPQRTPWRTIRLRSTTNMNMQTCLRNTCRRLLRSRRVGAVSAMLVYAGTVGAVR
jgi:hypothetical protein